MVGRKIFFGILVLSTLVFFSTIFLNPGKILYSNHSTLTFKEGAYNLYLYRMWRETGELPLWNPTFYSGHPMDLTISPIYPPKLLMYFFPSDQFFGYYYVLHILLVGVFTFLYARIIGLRELPSLLSAISFMFSGFIIQHFYSNLTELYTSMIWLPLILYAIERLFLRGSTYNIILLGVAYALEIHAGHPQMAFYTTYFTLLYIAFKLFVHRDGLGRLVKSLIASALVGILLSMSVISVMFFFSTIFPRSQGVDYDYSIIYSYNPVKLITLLIPEFFGSALDESLWYIDSKNSHWEVTMYIGVIPFILVLYALRFVRNKWVSFYTGTFILFLLLASGGYLPAHKLAYNILPGFNMFRAPHRLLLYAIFALSMLAGFGFEFGLKPGLDKKRIRFNAIILVFFMVFIIFLSGGVFLFEHNPSHPIFAKYWVFSIQNIFSVKRVDWMKTGLTTFMALSISSLVLLSLRDIEKSKFVLGFIVLMVFCDLYMYGVKYVMVADPNEIYPKDELTEFLKNDESKFRVMGPRNILPVNRGIRSRLEKVNGYGHIQYNDYRTYIESLSNEKLYHPFGTRIEVSFRKPNLLHLLNVKYVFGENHDEEWLSLVTEVDIPDFLDGEPHGGVHRVPIYVNEKTLPRAYFVPNAMVVVDRDRILELLVDDSFDIRNIVILEKNPSNKLANEGFYTNASVLMWTPNRIVVGVNAPSDGFLVLSEVWFPGWRAQVDGKDSEILRGDFLFRVVPVSEGKHNVEFEFKPQYFYVGLYVTLLTAVIVVAYLLIERKKTPEGLNRRADKIKT